MPITAVSRKMHQNTNFDVALPLTGRAGVECRQGQGANHDQHQIIVTFPRAISYTGASVTSGTATIASRSQNADRTQLTINLSGVTNAQTIFITITGVNDGNLTNDVKIAMAVLLGDTNGDGFTDAVDESQVKSQSGSAVTTSNFREDPNLDRFIDAVDTSLVKGQSGTALPNAPQLVQPTSASPSINVQYSYDDDGKNTHLFATSTGTQTGGYDLTFGYNDGQGRFRTITQAGLGQIASYAYDLASNETHRTTANGLDQVYGRDSLNRMTNRTINQGSTAVSVEVYGYDPARPGLMTSVTHQEGSSATHDSFGYDLLPELQSANYNLQGAATQAAADLLSGVPVSPTTLLNFIPPMPPPRNVSYDWDRAGNRKSLTDSMGPSYNYLTNSLNQYLTDGISNMTNGSEHELASYQAVNYSYINDSHVWLIAGTDIFGQQSRYEMYYDALGRRVVTVLNGSTTYYIYDGEKAILEYRGWSGGPSAANVYGKSIDEIIKRTDYTRSSNQNFYYQDDHEGSITHLTDSGGNILEYYRYDAFGKPAIYDGGGHQIQTSAFNNRFMFTGREYVANFGVYEYRNRAYHPGLGRFMSEDPKGFAAGDYNLFRYCHNDPVDFVDAMGTDITVNYYSASPAVIEPFGHIGLGPSPSETYGFYGNHAPFTNSGSVYRDTAQIRDSLTIHTFSAEQDAKIMSKMKSFDHTRYNLLTRQCSYAVCESLKAGGINVPYDARPEKMFYNIRRTLPGEMERVTITGSAPEKQSERAEGQVANSMRNSGDAIRLGGKDLRTTAAKFGGMTYVGRGYVSNGNGGLFTSGALQRAAGNYGAWNANHFGAMQSSPFQNDVEGSYGHSLVPPNAP